MATFYDVASDHLPSPVAEDLLKRYGMIGIRLEKLHKVYFGTTYGENLISLGHESVARHLRRVQTQRNAFMHGNPEAIDDHLVEETVRMMPSFHRAWIACFNYRCARLREGNA